MHFDRNSKGNSKSHRKNSNSTMSNIPTNTVPLSTLIPKNNFGIPPRYNQLRLPILVAHPDDGTFSPIPPDFRYTIKFPSHYPESSLDWREPSFGFNSDSLEDNSLQNISTEQHNPPLQEAAPANDDLFNELYLDNSILDDEKSEKAPANLPQNSDPIPTPAPMSATATRNADNGYQYNNLEEALDFWLSTLSVNHKTKIVYRSRLIKFIRMLDEEGIRKPNFTIIEKYCSKAFDDNKTISLGLFEANLKRFLKWMSNNDVYKKIRSFQASAKVVPVHQERPKPKIDPKIQFISKALSDAFNEWSKALKNDINTNSIYKTQVLNFMMFLIQLKTLSPTLSNIQNYFHNSEEIQGLNASNNCKKVIKSFLEFLEQMAIPQNPEVYKFLDSNKTK